MVSEPDFSSLNPDSVIYQNKLLPISILCLHPMGATREGMLLELDRAYGPIQVL
jgi:hypothetical protein